MSKFIKESELKSLKLSEYLKLDKSQFQCFLCDEKYRKPRTEYIMEIIGDVELDESTYKLFLEQFQRGGGRYDVRLKRETIKGIYDILQKYPFLSAKALDEIWFVYIDDQFKAYKLDEVLEKFIERYGKTDDAFGKYIDFIDEVAKEYDKQFELEAVKLKIYCEEYDQDFIKHLQYVIKSQHILADKIIGSLPSQELITKDQKQLGKIMSETRIFFGACHPISYQMIESLVADEGLDGYPEQPQYLICGTKKIDTTFTKQEFLDSIKEKNDKKQKVLKIK